MQRSEAFLVHEFEVELSDFLQNLKRAKADFKKIALYVSGHANNRMFSEKS